MNETTIIQSELNDKSLEGTKYEILRLGLFTVGEAAEFLKISRSKLYEMMDSGEIAFVKLGRSRRIPKMELFKLMARNLVQVAV